MGVAVGRSTAADFARIVCVAIGLRNRGTDRNAEVDGEVGGDPQIATWIKHSERAHTAPDLAISGTEPLPNSPGKKAPALWAGTVL